MNIEIFPLKGITVDGISVDFGMNRADVEAVLGKGIYVKPNQRYYYHQTEISFSYDDNERLEYIEFLGGAEGVLRPRIYDVSVFDVDADELSEILKRNNGGEIKNVENEHSLLFLNICVGMYRSLTPAEVDEMIEEMKAHGIPTENNPDLEADMRKALHWETIGVGKLGYYQH